MTVNPLELTSGKSGTSQLFTEIITFSIVIIHSLNSHWHDGTVPVQVQFTEQTNESTAGRIGTPHKHYN